MAEVILFWGGIAGAITAILVLFSKVFSKSITKFREFIKKFDKLQEHTEENYLNNLRIIIMLPEMPIGERLNAGEKYIKAGGNGEVKAFYKKLLQSYLEGGEDFE